ncbi:uncharacterized protein [Coffea arabica]|uniref:3-oxo-5-alpha-steroid 4-dehydrogenase C-terminal domain-containing protein n=1 Tax=Coffea arabica TaxID=13443 RepID=A0ABM4WED9_COFAR
MGLPEIVLRFLYPPPPSLFISAMSVISFASLTNAGFQEIKGKHMRYSKFFNVGASVTGDNKQKEAEFSGRTGMLVAYTPAFLAGVASFALVPLEGLRFTLLRSALTIHFLKRLFEVLFVHKYSGVMEVETAITISMSYFLSTASMIYAQHLTSGLPEPPIDLKHFGILLFVLGISGNFYHHYLLSELRTEGGDNKYKIPHGGLFDLVICPHYLFEILGFVGVSCISQNLYAFSYTFGTMFYLLGRSYATRRWYQSKFDNFSENTKAVIPYIF